MILTRNSWRRLVLLASGFAAILLLSAFFVRQAKSTDPWTGPDSDMMPSGPIMDQQTADANFQAKLALQQQADSARQTPYTGDVTGKFSDPNYIPAIVLPTPAPKPTGIFQEGPLPIGWGALYRIANKWHGWAGSDYLTVYVGAKADDPAYQIWNDPNQGVLIVMKAPPAESSDPNPTTDEYLTPTRSGPIQVASYSGTCLTLTATTASGTTSAATFVFDVAARTWLCNASSGTNP